MKVVWWWIIDRKTKQFNINLKRRWTSHELGRFHFTPTDTWEASDRRHVTGENFYLGHIADMAWQRSVDADSMLLVLNTFCLTKIEQNAKRLCLSQVGLIGPKTLRDLSRSSPCRLILIFLSLLTSRVWHHLYILTTALSEIKWKMSNVFHICGSTCISCLVKCLSHSNWGQETENLFFKIP